MALATMGHLGKAGEPVSTEELARLSLMLKRIESTDKLRVQREQAAQKAAEAAKPKPRKGLSPETVALIDEAVLGKARWPVRTVTSVPIDPWNPEESPLSRSIPDNPGESRQSWGCARPGRRDLTQIFVRCSGRCCRRYLYSAAARAGAGISRLKRRAQLSPTTFALVSSSTLASTRFSTSWL